jgi:hypothetical protein
MFKIECQTQKETDKVVSEAIGTEYNVVLTGKKA